MFILMRALAYATLFTAVVLLLLPSRVLDWAGIAFPGAFGLPQAAGTVLAIGGAALALWSVLAFAIIGRGTPAPFDAPRQLVVRGPYRYVRNPMYLGAALALAGAACAFESLALFGYLAVFVAAFTLFAIGFEEPTLRRAFGREYEDYCQRVHRWWPRF
jgi:protein-S-isoprenylcysteine O-methyltransferase Ste14